MGVAAKLGKSANLGKCDVKIAQEAAGNKSISDYRQGTQSERKILDMGLENLFETS
jgi:hypothetical protein